LTAWFPRFATTNGFNPYTSTTQPHEDRFSILSTTVCASVSTATLQRLRALTLPCVPGISAASVNDDQLSEADNATSFSEPFLPFRLLGAVPAAVLLHAGDRPLRGVPVRDRFSRTIIASSRRASPSRSSAIISKIVIASSFGLTPRVRNSLLYCPETSESY